MEVHAETILSNRVDRSSKKDRRASDSAGKGVSFRLRDDKEEVNAGLLTDLPWLEDL